MDKESTHGRTEVITKEDGETTKSTVLEHTSGRMEGSIKDNG